MALTTTTAPGTARCTTLGVVIVNYQTYDLTMRCVASLLAQGIAEPAHIVVVDNDSPDASGLRLQADLPAGVVTLLSGRNGGFGAGVNLGVDALKTDLVLILNPDTYFESNRMDEGYFLYFEEVDLCARMWIEGWQVVAVPQVALVHDHQRSSAAGIMSFAGKTHLRSMARFFAKFGVPWWSRPSRVRMAAALARWQAAQQGGSVAGAPVTEPQHGG